MAFVQPFTNINPRRPRRQPTSVVRTDQPSKIYAAALREQVCGYEEMITELRAGFVSRETLASADRLRFDVDSVPACLGAVEFSLAPVIARLDVFSRACVEESDLCAMYIRELRLFEAELAANARPSDDSEPEPTPNASASSGGP